MPGESDLGTDAGVVCSSSGVSHVRSIYGRSDKQRIAAVFPGGRAAGEPHPRADYNIAPTTFQPVIRLSRDTGARDRHDALGLDPTSRSPPLTSGLSTINAHAETLQEKPSCVDHSRVAAAWFQSMSSTNGCALTRRSSRTRTQCRITSRSPSLVYGRPGRILLTVSGSTFAIVTTSANELAGGA